MSHQSRAKSKKEDSVVRLSMTTLKHKKKNIYQPKMNYRGNLYLINDSNTKTTVIRSEETATILCPINREQSPKRKILLCAYQWLL